MASIDLCKVPPVFGAKIGGSDWLGPSISGAIAVGWILSLGWMLSWNLADCSAIAVVFGIWVRTFLHTGLFAIAHDAMHDNVFPSRPAANRWSGRLALGLYGFLPYQFCRQRHWRHHCYPGQACDPDYHENSQGFAVVRAVHWYVSFLSTYLTPQLLQRIGVGIAVVGGVLAIGAGVSWLNLILFWIVPWCLSSVQLFFFGTYLPHRSGSSQEHPHAACSYYFPLVGSLLACYHFSYHWEHHAYPNIPWYLLPAVARIDLAPTPSLWD